MQTLRISELVPHPQNEFFFDDMTGQKWEEFLESIRTSGVIEPPVVTPVDDKYMIVSGHQRIRACKELGINEVHCEVKGYVGDRDKITKDLIETNIRQRGNINTSDLKLSRIIKELERIYGVRQGSAGKSEVPMELGATAKDIADKIGIDINTYKRTKKLLEVIPEIQNLLDEGVLPASAVSRVIAKLSEEEQLSLLEKLPAAEKFTQAQIQSYIGQIQSKDKQIADLQAEAAEAVRAIKAGSDSEEYMRAKKAKEDLEGECRKEYEARKVLETKVGDKDKQIAMLREQFNNATKKLNELQRQKEVMSEPEVREVEVEVEVYPEDYERLKRERQCLDEENERLSALVASLKVNHHVARNPFDGMEEEDDLEGYYDKVTMFAAAVVPEIDSIMVGAERFALMTVSQREFIGNRITQCIHSFNQMMAVLKNSNKEAA